MYQLENRVMRYRIDELGQVCSCYNRLTKHEYIYLPGNLWKIIYSEGERQEIPIYSTGQEFNASLDVSGRELTMEYPRLLGDGRLLAVSLTLRFTMLDDRISITVQLKNNDPATVQELQITAASGIRSLAGSSENDTLTWPHDLGRKVVNPAFADLSIYAGFRKYERHDQFHTDMDGLYPGRLGMQWLGLYNDTEGLYVGVHNAIHQTICMHAERDVKLNILRLGGIFYPMLAQGEEWSSEPVVYAAHKGDWHTGARIYRAWIESTGWKAPEQPDWVRNWKGWLRVILKQHHGELNWDYGAIPSLYDEAEAAGMDTIFLLGWERGGFARMWPDYYADEGSLGGEQLLRSGIEYVHGKGGKVVMFLSYLLIDRESEFYKSGKGEEATVKSIWGTEVPFSETYCGEGTYRKVGNPPMPMFFACPHSEVWHQRMLEATKYCLDIGADGVLYDLGGHPAYFCFDKRHGHEKPSMAYSQKDKRYKELHDYVRSRGADKITMMEDNIDIFAQHMDITQGTTTRPKPDFMLELYRYTFPECIMTNRECGEDEENYLTYANHSFVYGLRFDMTIHRCCGTLSDIPHYAEYLSYINKLRDRYADYLLCGRFVDNEGFTAGNGELVAKGYKAADGRLAVAIWNPTGISQQITLVSSTGVSKTLTLEPNSVDVAELV